MPTAVVFLYCEYSAQGAQTLRHLLGSILRQLEPVSMKPSIEDLYGEYHGPGGGRELPLEAMLERIHLGIRTFKRVYMIVDALDECGVWDQLLHDYVAHILKDDSCNIVKFFATSRPIGSIQRFFQEERYPVLDLLAKQHDISLYLNSKFEEFHRLRKPLYDLVQRSRELKQQVIDQVCEQAAGMCVTGTPLLFDLIATNYLLL